MGPPSIHRGRPRDRYGPASGPACGSAGAAGHGSFAHRQWAPSPSWFAWAQSTKVGPVKLIMIAPELPLPD